MADRASAVSQFYKNVNLHRDWMAWAGSPCGVRLADSPRAANKRNRTGQSNGENRSGGTPACAMWYILRCRILVFQIPGVVSEESERRAFRNF